MLRVSRRLLSSIVSNRSFLCFDKAPGLDPNSLKVDIYPDFVSQEEHDGLVKQVDAWLGKKRYMQDHWDSAILRFREAERSFDEWAPSLLPPLTRAAAQIPGEEDLRPVHCLDLHEKGKVLPHIEAVPHCGPAFGGVCLLSAAVMVLKSKKNPDWEVEMFLPPRCMYVIQGEARFYWTHEIGDITEFGKKMARNDEERKARTRRISLLFRRFAPKGQVEEYKDIEDCSMSSMKLRE